MCGTPLLRHRTWSRMPLSSNYFSAFFAHQYCSYFKVPPTSIAFFYHTGSPNCEDPHRIKYTKMYSILYDKDDGSSRINRPMRKSIIGEAFGHHLLYLNLTTYINFDVWNFLFSTYHTYYHTYYKEIILVDSKNSNHCHSYIGVWYDNLYDINAHHVHPQADNWRGSIIP